MIDYVQHKIFGEQKYFLLEKKNLLEEKCNFIFQWKFLIEL